MIFKWIIALLIAIGLAHHAPLRAQHKDHGHDHAATTPAKDDHDDHDDHDEDAHDDHDDHGHDDHDDHGHAGEVHLTADAIRLAGIRVETVKKQPLQSTLTAHARVAFNAETMAHVGSLITGRVAEVKVRVGDVVKTGDPLLILESTELGKAQSEYLQKRTDVAIAEATVQPATQSAARARKLYDQNQGIALAELQKREAEVAATEGAVMSAKAAVTAAANQLRLLGMTAEDIRKLESDGELDPLIAVRAPISGRVIEREVTLGELVSPEKEHLLVLANTETVWVLAEIPESRLAQVKVGTTAKIEIAAMPGNTLEGTVSHIATALNPDTRAGRVRIEVDNAEGALRPGMFATAILSSAAEGESALAVPDEAIQTIEGQKCVFVPVEGEANTFLKRPVTVGAPVGSMLPIISGLKAGESIVTRGSFILKAELGKSEASHGH